MNIFLLTLILLFLFVPSVAAQDGDYLGCSSNFSEIRHSRV